VAIFKNIDNILLPEKKQVSVFYTAAAWFWPGSVESSPTASAAHETKGIPQSEIHHGFNTGLKIQQSPSGSSRKSAVRFLRTKTMAPRAEDILKGFQVLDSCFLKTF
jgi:hypothetical protein